MSAVLLTLGCGFAAWVVIAASFLKMMKTQGRDKNGDTLGGCLVVAAPFAMIAAGLVAWVVGL